MPVQERKARERAARHQLIVTTARELAENEGWDAVTTRRLAERIEYSQPVLYSHFRGKDEIVGAVALEGFAEIAAVLRAAVDGAATPRAAVDALASAYVAFAEGSPTLYDAMFALDTGLTFADPATPEPLLAGFAAIVDAVSPFAGVAEPALVAETFWAALHGLVTLTRAGRLPGERRAERLELVIDQLVRPVGPDGERSSGAADRAASQPQHDG
jgi:AcrR family transcriptional regulator